MRGHCIIAILLFSTTYCLGQTHPFPQNLTYTSGSIKPNHKTTAQLNTEVELFYDAWKAKYIKNCSGKYYVDFTDENPAYITTSESHGYGMMITALIAGYDTSAKTIFDGMYQYYKAHYSSINNKLMSWQQGNCAVAGGNDDAATDGDLDIGYALLLADSQWGSGGTINYLNEAKVILQAILTSEVHPASSHPLVGDWVSTAADLKLSRTSDFLLDHFKAFGAATGDARWNTVYEKVQALIGYLQSSAANASQTGLLPDFIQNADTPTPTIPTGQVLETPQDGWYNWNACRDPWRISTDYLLSGDGRSKAAANKIITWLVGKSPVPASFTCATPLDGSGTSNGELAFVAPYMVGMMVDPSHQAVLNTTYDWVIQANISSFTYFHNTLKMLCLLTATGNYWAPGVATGLEEAHSQSKSPLQAFLTFGNDELFIQVISAQILPATVMVTDAKGAVIYSRKDNFSMGLNALHVPCAGIVNGLYFVSILTAENRLTLKFSKTQ